MPRFWCFALYPDDDASKFLYSALGRLRVGGSVLEITTVVGLACSQDL